MGGGFVGRKAVLLLAPMAGLVPLLLATAQPATASAPVNTAVPTVTGTAKVRETLTANPGSWSANPSPPSYAYQWQRCQASVSTSTTAVGQVPAYLTVDSNGNVYTSNYTSQTVTKVTPDGTATTLGSTGTGPYAIAVDRAGNVYTANNGANTVTKITPAGVSSTFGTTGTNPIGIAVDGEGNVYTANYSSNNVTKITPAGVSSTLGSTGLNPYGIAVDSAGNVYASNFGSNNVTKFPSGGSPTILASTGSNPVGIAVDSAGNVYTANYGSNDVTKITSGGSSSTLGSTGANPYGLAIDSAGNVYTADAGPDQVTKITPGGSSSVLASTGSGSNPRGIAVYSDGSVYTADSSSDRITKISQYSCSDINTASSPSYVAQPADAAKYLRVRITADNGVLPNGTSFSMPSGPVEATASRTLYVNKYSPGDSSVPGCLNPDFTAIGSADPAFGAVGGAVSGDTIFICGSPTAATDPYTPAVVLGSKSLNFVGEGPELTILDGQNDRTLFFANAYDSGQPNTFLNLQSLTVKRGLDINDGGGIEAFCRDIALSNVHFIDNKTIGFGFNGGGGMSVQEAGCPGVSDVTVNSSVFTGNIAEFNPAYGQWGSDGGAIRTTGSVTIDGSRFANNEARATTSSPRTPRGGAIWAGAGVSISDSSFISNGAVGPGAFGGAIYSEGGPSTSTISGSTFSANAATGANSFAGAIRRQTGDLTVTNSTFTGNQAADAPALSSSDSITLKSITLSANSGPYDVDAGYNLSIGNSIINETGEACRAPQPPSTYKVNLGGNVIADTTLSDCDPFVGTGGGPATKVDPSAIQLGALADNGGPTQTMAIGLTSAAATSAGVNLLGSGPRDQRGRNRPATNQSSGAYQLTEPANTAVPQITGDAEAGETLTTSTGTWSVSPPVTSYDYQWQRCEVSNSPSYVSGWGGAGSGNGQFSSAEWLAIDASGNVFVADGGNNRIQKFDASGNYLGKWGTAGSGPGQFQNIGGIAVGPGGEVYVTDTGNNRIQMFTNSGTYIRQWGSQGSGNGQFNSPGPLATDSSGNVFVSDSNNSRVQKFTSNGSYLTQWGSSGSGPGQFSSPGAIAVDPSGNVYVIDIWNYRVEKFTGSGTFITQWGSNGSGNGQFTAPSGIAVASSGTVYVADRNTSRIQAFSPTGTYLFQWGTAGSGPGQIDDPGGLAFGTGGDLYEADVYNARIQRFSTLACTAIPGATSNTYPQTRDEMGKTIRVEVVVDNGVPPPEEALSFPTTPVLAIPQDSSSPTIAGIPAEGETLTASSGTWSGYPTLTLSFQWQRCEQDGTGCTDITGATNPTYTATGADVGKKLRVTETGSNVAGDATADSSQVGPVTGPPVNTEPPSVTGDTVLGSTLTANPGTWSGYPDPTLSLQWQRCDVGGSNCTDIAGATGPTYVLGAEDEGKEIRIVVTAANSISKSGRSVSSVKRCQRSVTIQ